MTNDSSKFTYSIFDADPNSSGDTEWPGHAHAQLRAADLAAAEERVEEIMAAASYSEDDGYEIGQTIYAIIWDEDGTIVAKPTYEITAEDLGVEEPSTSDRLTRAAAYIDATELADGRWAHYADETGRWHVVTADELEELCDYMDDEDEQISGDAYSHWCAGTSAKEMPAGWEPGQAERSGADGDAA